jgi:hypothetical protein
MSCNLHFSQGFYSQFLLKFKPFNALLNFIQTLLINIVDIMTFSLTEERFNVTKEKIMNVPTSFFQNH